MSTQTLDSGEVVRLWTREEFHQAQDLGWFNNEKVELIHGEVYTKRLMKPLHALGVCACAETLTSIFILTAREKFMLPELASSMSLLKHIELLMRR